MCRVGPTSLSECRPTSTNHQSGFLAVARCAAPPYVIFAISLSLLFASSFGPVNISRSRHRARLTRDSTVPSGTPSISAASWWVNSATTTSSSVSRSSAGQAVQCTLQFVGQFIAAGIVRRDLDFQSLDRRPSRDRRAGPPPMVGRAAAEDRGQPGPAAAFGRKRLRLFQAERKASWTKSSASWRSPTKRYAKRYIAAPCSATRPLKSAMVRATVNLLRCTARMPRAARTPGLGSIRNKPPGLFPVGLHLVALETGYNQCLTLGPQGSCPSLLSRLASSRPNRLNESAICFCSQGLETQTATLRYRESGSSEP